ncbi:MAG TPA: hypothetical protein VLT45_26995, partial [Kofleriaceae bacterium]|nr:hypothetical protein [Kofleriaceae bacterium]
FVTGPALLLLIQGITLLVGLHLVFRARLRPLAAALAASFVFLFPFVAGVTAVITKDALMAGPLVIAIGLMLGDSRRAHRIALALLLFASLMRWNALAATFTPMLFLFRWRPDLRGVRRYAIAIAAWLAVTLLAYAANTALTSKREYLWYWSFAYEDISGTLEYMPDVDDAHMNELLAGVPLVYHDRLHERFRAIYSPISHYHLMRDSTKLFEVASTDLERTAIADAWKRIVLGHPAAYLHYRWDSFRSLIGLDWGDTFSRVYVWFNVIADPQAINELHHDATSSHLQAQLMRASVWFSLTRLYAAVIYLVLGLLLIPLCRTSLEWSLLLSGLAYEAQWFFLAATPDARYSQWLVICTLVTAILVGARLARSRAPAS